MNHQPADPLRILVIVLWPLGDTLFTTPALTALRSRYPDATIDAVAYRSNAPIVRRSGQVDTVLEHPTRFTPAEALRWMRTLAQLRSRRYQLSVEFSGLGLTLSRLVLAIPRRVTTPFPDWWWMLPGRDPGWGQRHAAQHCLDTLLPLGIVPAGPLRLAYQVSPADRREAFLALRQHAVAPGSHYAVVHPGGEGLQGGKRWPVTHFAAVARQLSTRGLTVVVVGGPDERELGRAIASRAAVIDLTGSTGLPATAAIIERAALFVGNDSAPLHLASALGVPAIGIYGPSNLGNFHPIGQDDRVRIAHQAPPCYPCFTFAGTRTLWSRQGCDNPVCLTGTSVADVMGLAAGLLRRQLAEVSPGPPSRAAPLSSSRTPGLATGSSPE